MIADISADYRAINCGNLTLVVIANCHIHFTHSSKVVSMLVTAFLYDAYSLPGSDPPK